MGKAMTIFGFWIVLCGLLMLYQESVQELDPSATFTGYAIFSTQNLLSPYISRSASGDLVFSNDIGGSTPVRSSTGTDTGTVAYPDWTQSLFDWIKIFSPIINFVGTPYYLFMWMSPGSSAAVFGAILSILNLVIIIGWLTGRID